MAPPKREASPSEGPAPKKPRRTKKIFAPPEGWQETPGWTTKPIHTSRCDMGQCGRHVTDDNPAKQCKCGLNICWICEQARGGLHRGLWHDCVHYRAAQLLPLPAPPAATTQPAPQPTEPSQPAQPLAKQAADVTATPVSSVHHQVTINLHNQPNHVAETTTTRAARSGSAPPTFGDNVFMDKSVGQMKVSTPHKPQGNEMHNVLLKQTITFRETPAIPATPQIAAASTDTEMSENTSTGQGSTGPETRFTVNRPEVDPTLPATPAAVGPPVFEIGNIGQSPPLPAELGYKEPIVRMRELTLLFRRPVALSLRPLPRRHIHAAQDGQALTRLLLSPSIEDVVEFEDIATGLATCPHELDGIGVFILRCLSGVEDLVDGGSEFGNEMERCVQGLSSEISEACLAAASRLESFTERWSPIEIMDSLLERVKAIRSHYLRLTLPG